MARQGAVAENVAARPTAGSVAEGRKLYDQACVVCHGPDGKGGHGGGAPLAAVRDLASAIQTVTMGRNNMPPFSGTFTPEQIRDVSTYVVDALARIKHKDAPARFVVQSMKFSGVFYG